MIFKYEPLDYEVLEKDLKQTINKLPGGDQANLPWKTSDNNYQDPFFGGYEILPDRWDQFFPYRLVVVEADDNGNYQIKGQSSIGNISTKGSLLSSTSGLEYVVSEEVLDGSWICNLPITPQQLQVTDQFAINTTATMRGVIEEHNGLKFKIISAAGTTGIWPRKESIGAKLQSPSSAQSIFAGTIAGVTQLSESVSRLSRSFDGSHPAKVTERTPPQRSEAGQFSTGYYQALYMQQFFERYAQAKKDPANKRWRLVLDNPKQNQSFIVSPMQFNLSQSHQKPNEIMFNFQLKAWKRIKLDGVKAIKGELPKLDSNTFQDIVNTIRGVRQTLSDSINLVKSVRSDWRRVMDVGRQISLAIKDTAGLVLAISDLPNQFIRDFDDLIINEWNSIQNSFIRPGIVAKGNSKNTTNTIPSAISATSGSSAEKSGAVIDSVVATNEINEGLSSAAVASGALGTDAVQSQQTNPMNYVFDNPEEYFELFDAVEIDSLPLNDKQQEAIDNELEKIRLLTVDDFRDMKNDFLQLSLDISNSFGAGDDVYASVYGRPDPKDRVLPMTVEENEVLVSIMEAVQALDILTSTRSWDNLTIESPLEYVGGLANQSDIEFLNPQGKISVPVPFGLTIEEIAARYLQNPDKWIEIATLNSLKSPYIDEDGFSYDFLSNAEGRRFNVDDSDSQLFIGQQIVLGSDVVPQFIRYITDIDQVGDNNFLITVDGLADLDNLKTTDNAFMQGYLPGTVNSQNQIYIPVDSAPLEDDQTFAIPTLSSKHLNQISKVDWLLTDNGDLAINSVGDLRLANGLNNLIQALKLKIRTRKSTLLRHLNYGLGLKHGVSIADLESGAILRSLNEMIQEDPRFDFISRLELKLKGPTLAIDMSVNLVNGNGVLPLNFEIRL